MAPHLKPILKHPVFNLLLSAAGLVVLFFVIKDKIPSPWPGLHLGVATLFGIGLPMVLLSLANWVLDTTILRKLIPTDAPFWVSFLQNMYAQAWGLLTPFSAGEHVVRSRQLNRGVNTRGVAASVVFSVTKTMGKILVWLLFALFFSSGILWPVLGLITFAFLLLQGFRLYGRWLKPTNPSDKNFPERGIKALLLAGAKFLTYCLQLFLMVGWLAGNHSIDMMAHALNFYLISGFVPAGGLFDPVLKALIGTTLVFPAHLTFYFVCGSFGVWAVNLGLPTVLAFSTKAWRQAKRQILGG